MKFNCFIDRFISNILIYVSHTLMFFIWYYIFYNLVYYENFLLFYFPYGIVILAFLFFGNKIIFGMLFSYITLYFVLKDLSFELPFNNFFALSTSQLVCVPLTLFVFRKFNVTIGASEYYKINKTDIFHVLLLIFCSTIMLGTMIFFFSLFFYNQTDLLTFTTGSLLGSGILIVLIKILVNIPNLIKSLIKSN